MYTSDEQRKKRADLRRQAMEKMNASTPPRQRGDSKTQNVSSSKALDQLAAAMARPKATERKRSPLLLTKAGSGKSEKDIAEDEQDV